MPVVAVLLCAGLGGCAGTSLTNAVGAPALTTGSLGSPKANAAIPPPQMLSGTPTAIYSKVARGANSCWFGHDGPLKTTHSFYAEVQPEHKGGGAEIVIRQQPKDQPPATAGTGKKKNNLPREKESSFTAMRISINRAAGTTVMAVVNRRFDPETARHMSADAYRWAMGKDGCQPFPQPAIANAAPAIVPPATLPAKPSAKPR